MWIGLRFWQIMWRVYRPYFYRWNDDTGRWDGDYQARWPSDGEVANALDVMEFVPTPGATAIG